MTSKSISSESPTGSAVAPTSIKCTNFEPQQWRRTVCKTCFKTAALHPPSAPAGEGDGGPKGGVDDPGPDYEYDEGEGLGDGRVSGGDGVGGVTCDDDTMMSRSGPLRLFQDDGGGSGGRMSNGKKEGRKDGTIITNNREGSNLDLATTTATAITATTSTTTTTATTASTSDRSRTHQDSSSFSSSSSSGTTQTDQKKPAVVGGVKVVGGGGGGGGVSGKRELGETVKQQLDKPLLLYFSETDLSDSKSDTRSDTRSETGSEGALEEFSVTRDMEECCAEETVERDTSKLRFRGSLSRGFEKSRAELSRLDDENDDGSNALVSTLRDKVCAMDEQCEKLDREKSVLADLLAAKKKDFELMKSHYKKQISELEEEASRLKSEKSRLVDKLKLPESERASLAQQENDIAELKKRLDEAEAHTADLIEENAELKQEVKDIQLEMEEMHDQFREEEAIEFRELQKELETTAKSCRILQFKLRKVERRNEQLEAERIQAEDKVRHMESRLHTSDDKQHIVELEEELRAAKEAAARLSSELESVEERRARYEEELDRVNDLVTQSESRRKELELEMDKNKKNDPTSAAAKSASTSLPTSSLTVPKAIGLSGKQGSQEVDIAQLMRDLSDSLERENDVKEQLKFSEEETRIIRKKLSDLEEENESINLQLHKLSQAKSGKYGVGGGGSGSGGGGGSGGRKAGESPEVITEREQELRLQMELAEQEVKVLRRKLDERDKHYEVLLNEVKVMASRVDVKGGGEGRGGVGGAVDGRSQDEVIQDLAKDIEKLKWRLMEKDKDADKLKVMSSAASLLQKSKSLEDGGTGYMEYQVDYRRQLETVQQEARVLKEKITDLERENDLLSAENKKLSIMSGRSSTRATTSSASHPSVEELQSQLADQLSRIKQLEAENLALNDSVGRLDERAGQLSKEVVRAKFGTVAESSVEWRELRSQVQFLEDENRVQRRKAVDLEAVNSKLQAELSRLRGETTQESSKLLKELSTESPENLRKRVVELENELASVALMLKNREEDNDRLEEEVTESRDDMNKMLDSFRRREQELADDLKSLQHKNAMLSDLLDLVTERAESTQKDLDRQRKDAVGLGATSPDVTSSVTLSSPTVATASVDSKESQKQIEMLKRQLDEEKRRVHAAEKKLKMAADVPLSEVKDDTRLRQHEKAILIQELALCQKQLKAANDQISELKERLLSMRESHEDIKEDFAKVSKQLEQAREQKTPTDSPLSPPSLTSSSAPLKGSPSAVVKVERAPASWRWEKQEFERQLKELKKKLDDSYSEMKRSQQKWKAAGEDIERDNKIKEELEKKISKLKEDCETNKKLADKFEDQLDEAQDQLRKKERQWEKEKHILDADKSAAETDAKQKDDVIKSKDEIIRQKNQLIVEKDAALADRNEAIQQKDLLIQQKDVELEFKERELRSKTEEMDQFRSELFEFRAHLQEKEERIKQLDDHVRRRDERLNEKDVILTGINRKLVEKGNQISDMDKTIRQVIRKLQARDCDLSMCNAELRRVQAELKALQERLQESKHAAEQNEAESRKRDADWRNSVIKLEAGLKAEAEKVRRIGEELKEAEETSRQAEEKWKTENDRIQMELNKTQERLHVQEITQTMNQTEAFKLMMREKEGLIADKYKLNDELKTAKKQLSSSTKQWTTEKETLEKTIEEKSNEIDEINMACEKLQREIVRLKDLSNKSSSSSSGARLLAPLIIPSSSSLVSSAGGAGLDDVTDLESARQVISSLRGALDQQELNWRAEKATLEEFYEASAHSLQDTVAHLKDTCAALRRENEGQLQLLQSSRRALSDLRNRYDVGSSVWADDRQRLQAANDQIEDYRVRLTNLERTLDRLRTELSVSEGRRQETDNCLTVERSVWKSERIALEEKIKKSGGEEKSASTRVSEFRAKFEKFGSSKSKKDGVGAGGEGDKDVQEICKDLQQQLSEGEKLHQKERGEWAQRAEQLKIDWEREKKELKDKNNVLERKTHDMAQIQRSLVDVQFRLVEDRHQWQQERAQLQHELEDWRKAYLSQKESINKLLAEVKKLRILASGLDLQGASPSPLEGGTKPRLRSITPSAERLRVSNLSVYSAARGANSAGSGTGVGQGAGGENGGKQQSLDSVISDDTGKGRASLDQQPVMLSLVQAIEQTSRLADDVTQARLDHKTLSRSQGTSLSFKRSRSSAEVEGGPSRGGATATTASGGTSHLHPPADHHYGTPGTAASSSSSGGMPGYFASYGRIAPSPILINSSGAGLGVPGAGLGVQGAGSSVSGELSRESSIDEEPTYSIEEVAAARSSFRKPTTSSSNRGSMYASGTQSAYGSRDASPDKAHLRGGVAVRKISPYPTAPPNMIITPSHTPRRADSIDDDDSLTNDDILRIYAKLNAMERDDESRGVRGGGNGAVGGRGRTLGVKSASVDVAAGGSSNHTQPALLSIPGVAAAGGGPRSSSSHADPSAPRDDGGTRSRQQVRGGVVGGVGGRSTSVDAARRQFYDEYSTATSTSSNDYASNMTSSSRSNNYRLGPGEWGAGGYEPPDSRPLFASSKSFEAVASPSASASPAAASPGGGGEEKSASKSKFSASSFFQSVKEKRKLFGTKKSSSVDSSATGASIAKMGANVLTEPAAPSTYQPPDISVHGKGKGLGVGGGAGTGGGGIGGAFGLKHKRTTSIDSSLALSTTITAPKDGKRK